MSEKRYRFVREADWNMAEEDLKRLSNLLFEANRHGFEARTFNVKEIVSYYTILDLIWGELQGFMQYSEIKPELADYPTALVKKIENMRDAVNIEIIEILKDSRYIPKATIINDLTKLHNGLNELRYHLNLGVPRKYHYSKEQRTRMAVGG